MKNKNNLVYIPQITLGLLAVMPFAMMIWSQLQISETVAPPVLGARIEEPVEEQFISNNNQTPSTESVFDRKVVTEFEEISYGVVEHPTAELYRGDTRTIQEGGNGSVTRDFELTLWNGEVVTRRLITEQVTEPVDQVIEYGTAIRYININTPEGELTYTDKFYMWSTSYDGNCRGCSGITYTGTTVYHGICAVDPNVIPLGSKLYIPGYGKCLAADIGGAIKGMKIDLGFENVRFGWWSARYTDVYLLSE